MSQVLIRDLDPEVIEHLKQRAAKHGRSLQAELKSILEQTARHQAVDYRAEAASLRRRLGGRKFSDSGVLQARDRRR
ncbi:MAG TPA: Arc family DNA-binding protein [Pyrinomonadaceae bacterium]|nr:Arc family DNA-binding protein [Pyrinomonadaceae bacterium]